MNGGTNNKVTVRTHVRGLPPNSVGTSGSVTVVYYYAEIKPVSGHSPKQIGAANSRLDNPFVIQLVDAAGRAIADQEVTFAPTPGTGGMLAADPATVDTLNDRNNRFITTTDADGLYESAVVKTDSNGRASIFLVLGSDAEEVTVLRLLLVMHNDQATFKLQLRQEQ